MDKTPKISFHALIDTLGLPVRLGMIRRAHSKICPSQFEEQLPKFACEQPIPVRDDRQRQAVQLIDVVQECSCHRCSRDRMAQRNEMGKPRELIDNHHITLAELDVGKPSIKSIEITSHDALDTGKGCKRWG